MTEDIKIVQNFNSTGFDIFLRGYNKTFYAKDSLDTLIEADTFHTLAEKIKLHVRQTAHFKHVAAIFISRDVVGRITSRSANDPAYINFRAQYAGLYRGEEHTHKELLMPYDISGDYSERSPSFVLDTPANRQVLEKIQGIGKQIKALYEQQAELRKTYTDPVTWVTLGFESEEDATKEE